MSWRASTLIGTTVALAGILAAPLPANEDAAVDTGHVRGRSSSRQGEE